jgi:hypothetical protein
MYWDITYAEYEADYRIRVHFRNGKSGVVDLKPLIDKGGVFSGLRDIDAFKAFSIDPEWHVLSWEEGRIDIAPETIYEEATGEKVLPLVAEEREVYGN